jgi:uncharacterized membrane protein
MQAFKNFRNYFLRGLAALLPTILTIWLFVQFYIFIQDKVSTHINRGLVELILWTTNSWDREFLTAFWVNGPGKITGFFVAIIVVVFLGAFLASVAGRSIWHYFEKALMNAPVIRKVYPYLKQITDFLLTKNSLSFSKVVAVEYPRKGAWSIGLVTGRGLSKIVSLHNEEYVTVFLPTTPTPFTGYFITVSKAEVVDMEMTIEEAFRFIVSGGVIAPNAPSAVQVNQNKLELKTN